ncbi:nuclear transport factor 2 family protein [Pseudonocardia sp. NPDC049635]|uniref:nuclear transport factor 2 family protein n=1 Tax=Pseudonocardia sp. NPDC049635 TaxID=3155506 RepID=UPI0033C038F8
MVTTPTAPTEVFQALSRALAAHDWDAAAALYAEDVRVVDRFAPVAPVVRTGRESVREFFTGLGGRLDSLTVEQAVVIPAADPEVVTVEFSFAASAGGGAGRFVLPAIFVLRVRGGEIVESHDYLGPRQGA